MFVVSDIAIPKRFNRVQVIGFDVSIPITSRKRVHHLEKDISQLLLPFGGRQFGNGQENVFEILDVFAFVLQLLIFDFKAFRIGFPGMHLAVIGDIFLIRPSIANGFIVSIAKIIHRHAKHGGNSNKLINGWQASTGFPFLNGLASNIEFLCKRLLSNPIFVS